MIQYSISSENPQSHYIDIELTITKINSNSIELQLPAWRPGRYELGNFAKNIKGFKVTNDAGKELAFLKQNKDLWLIETPKSKKIKVSYSYYTSEINAGNCYVDEQQLYVNPVHLCLYMPNRMNEEHSIKLNIPKNYKIACSLPQKNNTLTAASYDELADSPFIASATIQSEYYTVNQKKFWIHINGECKPDFKKLKEDFIKFTKTQINFWGDFPVNEYHFLFQVLPFNFYHGVEHQKSTVIAIGPGYAFNQNKVYEEILGVSSHELFHTWNIKYIRPKEMLPYDFSKENYARTGYVYEGFTTYYGDVLLLTSGVFNTQQYFNTLEERLNKHFHNYGRFNLPVAQSSWDTWLDGYVPGAPYRKTSIYDEGNLIALMLDVLILKYTKNKKGLKDVCRVLYNDFGKKHKGYSEKDIISLCEKTAKTSFTTFFENYVNGTKNFETQLSECFSYLGIEFTKQDSSVISESVFGFKTTDFGNNKKVSLIAPQSPSWKAGLSIGDEIIAVNGYTLRNDFNNWMLYFKDATMKLTVSSNQKLKELTFKKNNSNPTYFSTYKLSQAEKKSTNFDAWVKSNL